MTRQVVSISLDAELASQLERAATAARCGKSELVRNAVTGYLALKSWHETQDRAMRLAETRNIGPDDVEGLIDEVRAEPT